MWFITTTTLSNDDLFCYPSEASLKSHIKVAVQSDNLEPSTHSKLSQRFSHDKEK